MAWFSITLLPRAIRAELGRLDADGVEVRNLGYGRIRVRVLPDGGWVVCGASDVLKRLKALPDRAGTPRVADELQLPAR